MALVVFGLLLFLTRLPFLSSWLEDWDSVQFAMALHKYDLLNNIPHAPGYPIYILLGKFLLFFTHNDTLSLTLLSSISGAISIVFIFLIAREMFDTKTAIFSAIFASLLPIHFLMSVSPLTNMPGLAALLVFIFLLYKLGDKKPMSICFLGGLILGVRFTEIPIIICLLCFKFIKKRHFNNLYKYVVAFILGLLTWIVPLVFITGIPNFFTSYGWITNYVLSHDVAIARNTRIARIFYLLDIGYTKTFILASLIAIQGLLFKRRLLKTLANQFLLVWLISYLVPLIFIYNLEVTRYTLPLLPPLVILVSLFLTTQKTKILKFLSFIFLILVIFLITKASYYQAKTFKNNLPPSIAPVIYIKNNFHPNETVIIGSYIYRQLEYYAPEYKSYYEKELTYSDLTKIKYVVVDYSGLTDKLPKGINYKIVEQIDFEGDKTIYTRLPKVTLYILEIGDEQKNNQKTLD